METLKLSQDLSIETWKKIATKVQQLNLEGYNNDIFLKNLMLLRKILTEENVDTGSLERTPKYTPQIGASSLLQSIYDIKVGIHHKKAAFYENIYTLDELGIQTISFHPIESSYKELPFIEETVSMSRMEKILTDGSFLLSSCEHANKTVYDMDEIENANYLLELTLVKENNNTILHSSKAIIKNFNAIDTLPSKEEIERFSFPKKEILVQDPLDWDEIPKAKQSFQTFDKNTSEFTKYLVKDKEHYYKE